MTNYIFDNAAERETQQRFSSLESLYDPITTRHLVATGTGPGWRCWEIGGGSGSIGSWLSDRVGPEGHVLMTDIDPRFLAGRPRSNLEVRRHDVGLDPLPDTAFDLIHTRLVLIHVPQREATIARLVTALKPGGWLVVEDYDTMLVDRALPCVNADDAETARRCFRALRSLMELRGMDMSWGRSLYSRLAAAGLVNVEADAHFEFRPGGAPGARLDKANLCQVRDQLLGERLLTSEELDRFLQLLEDPDFVVAAPVMFSARGQRRR
jgi:ubiquinone/menaquinone biosynthesis C-methylase UbiE